MGGERFVIPVKSPDHKKTDVVVQLMILFAGILFGYTAIREPVLRTTNFVIILLIGGSLVYTYQVSSRKRKTLQFTPVLLITAIGWLFQEKWNLFFTLLYLVASLLEVLVKQSVSIGVDAGGITLQTFPQKHISWKELNNAVIKDGLFTIDLKTNRILQKEIVPPSGEFPEQAFNTFCQQQLHPVTAIQGDRGLRER